MTTKVRSSVLADTAVTPEKYGGTQTLQTITVDAQGRITHAANITSGVVTADTTGQGASILVPSIRFNALGQIVAATNTTIRSATTSVTGVVQLVDSVSSTSTTAAATGSAVKTAYDAAVNALNASNISSGTLPAARLSGSYTGITGVGTLTVGSIPFATSATSATNATFATSATNATFATSATSAGSATNASAATNATFATSATNATNATNVSGTGTVTVANLATAAKPIGEGQTWQNMTASRSYNVTYTNDTGRPIMVNIMVAVTVNQYVEILIGGSVVVSKVQWDSFASGRVWGTASAIIPAGNTYQAVSTGTNSMTWAELR